jgi:hypothetical protein
VSLAQQRVWVYRLPRLIHIPSLADVTMVTKVCTLLWGKNDLKALLASGIKDLWIYFDPIGRLS